MTWSNYDDVIAAMRAEGFDVTQLDIGKKVRVKRPGHSQKGWYVLHDITLDDGTSTLIGAWGYWQGAEAVQHKVKPGKGVQITPEQRQAIEARYKAEMKREAAERARKAERAAHMAGKAWRQYVPDGESDYLKRKGVESYGLRYAPSGNGTVAVPMMDPAGKIHGLQIVRGKNRGSKLEKEYWPAGLDKKGHYHLIGGTPRGVCLVCEGYATGATLHAATGHAVAVAFDAGNLTPVAQVISKTYKQARILICADDDYRTTGNPGQAAAQTASATVGGAYVLPIFSETRPEDKKGPTDFNDLHALEGLPVVRAQIEAKLTTLGWLEAPTRAGRALSKGGGENDFGWITVETMQEHFRLILTTEDYFDHRMNRVWSHSALIKATPRGVVQTWGATRERKYCMPEQVGFDPDGSQPEIICNLYDGWPTTPQAGKCIALLRLLMRLCGHEAERAEPLYEWVLDWHAFMIQHPGAKMATSIIVHGDQGGGKNMFFGRAIKPIFGKYGIEFGQNALEEKYNEWMSAKLYGIGNEVIASHESLYHMKGYIKNIVTENVLQIRPMHHSARQERNCLCLVFLSNELQPMNIDTGDRRFCVIWTPATPQKGDQGYDEFRDLISECLDELANGGSAALHQFLLNRDTGDFHEGTPPPMTKAKEDLIEISLDSKERFWREWSGESIGGVPCIPVPSELLYDLYRVWAGRAGVRSPAPLSKLIPTLTKMRGVEKRPSDRYQNGHGLEKATFIMPHFMHTPPPGKTRSTWLGDCVDEFRNALQIYKDAGHG